MTKSEMERLLEDFAEKLEGRQHTPNAAAKATRTVLQKLKDGAYDDDE